MSQTLVHYRTKPESADENQRLIEAVFKELEAKRPGGLRYLALRLSDGMFVHFVAAEGDTSPLTGLETFQVFRGDIKQRCVEAPQVREATIVGNYRMIST